METLPDTLPGDRKESSNGQLISVNRKDTCRLLEVFVKRSLSLNDSGQPPEPCAQRKNKWVMMPERPRRMRRHSSDPSLHLSPGAHNDYRSLAPAPSAPCPSETPANLPEEEEEEEVKEVKEVKPEVSVSKKKKKPTLWKSFLGLFSKKCDKEDPEEEIQRTDVFPSQPEELSGATDLPLTLGTSQKKKKSRRRSSSKRHRSFRKSFRKSSRIDITGVEAIVSVEPTYAYFEKVSEEMELIVHQVKEKEKVLTDEEVINRIIALTKLEGDAIDEKLKDNPTLSNFFQGMSYSSFQKLADTYLKAETTPVQNQAPFSLPPAPAPELVKLAFTLDFTARVAGLSRQNVGHITGLGNRYLGDRFEYTQACTDHPWSDSDD